MCINVAFPLGKGYFPASNKAQELAGHQIFFSKPAVEADLDDPIAFKILRVHFKERHEGGFRAEVPRWFAYTRHPEFLERGELSPEQKAFQEAIYQDTPAARGFWQSMPKGEVYISCTPLLNEASLYAKTGRWALLPTYPSVYTNLSVCTDDIPPYIVCGGWTADAYGCYLSYGLPVRPGRIKLLGDYGQMQVVVPYGTKFMVWVRCSDSGRHSGFVIYHLSWGMESACPQETYSTFVTLEPLLVSLFAAPHVFPEKGTFLELQGETLADAVALAETMAETGEFPVLENPYF